MADTTTKTPVEIAGEVAKKYGIPDYIWKPILYTESSGNPNSVAQTSSEYSVGLFQVNVLAHPQYRVEDLKNPAYNAEVAMRDFIKPAYDYLTAKGVTDQKQLANAVYSGIDPTTGKYYPSQYGGIRPAWTPQTQNVFNSYLKGQTAPFAEKTPNPLVDSMNQVSAGMGDWFDQSIKDSVNKPYSEISPEITNPIPELGKIQTVVKIVVILGLIGLLVVIILTLFPKQSIVSNVAKMIS